MKKKISDSELLLEVEKVCKLVFENPNLTITHLSNAAEIDNWDSMTNLILIDELEKKFNVKFSLENILEAQNIGDLCGIIKGKQI